MSVMFEVYYRSPADDRRESDLCQTLATFGGRLDFRETAERPDGSIVLTYEFEDRERAEAAARALRSRGEHVEGPQEYAS